MGNQNTYIAKQDQPAPQRANPGCFEDHGCVVGPEIHSFRSVSPAPDGDISAKQRPGLSRTYTCRQGSFLMRGANGFGSTREKGGFAGFKSTRTRRRSFSVVGGASCIFAHSVGSSFKNRPTEDRHLICSNLQDFIEAACQTYPANQQPTAPPILEDAKLQLVVDGHGGVKCAEFIVRHFVAELFAIEHLHGEVSSLEYDKDKVLQAVCDALVSTIHQLEESFLEQCKVDGDTSGACLVAALSLRGWLVAANVGDCEACLLDHRGRRVGLTTAHTATSNPREAERLRRAGADISSKGYIMGALKPSRVIGDWDVKQAQAQNEVILARPMIHFVRIKKLQDQPKKAPVLVLGSDGFWDIGQETAMKCIKKYSKLWRRCQQKTQITKLKQALYLGLSSGFDNPAEALVDFAIDRGSRDDVTVVFTQF